MPLTERDGFERLVRGSRHSDDHARASLQTIAEALGEATGFGVIGVSGIRDDGYLHVLTIIGPEDARATLIDSLAPVQPLLDQLAVADDWGTLKFVPQDRMVLDAERWGWVSTGPEDHRPEAWHPRHLLVAPVPGDQGQLLGVLGMELPADGLVPTGERRALVDMHARQACRAISAILERERFAEQIRLTSAAADIVRRATGKMSINEVLDECSDAIVEGFRAQALWSQLIDGEPRAVLDSNPLPLTPELIEMAESYAVAAWDQQSVGVFAPERPPPPPLSQDIVDGLLDYLDGTGGGAGSVLFVPLGAGPECLGWFALTRAKGGAEWTDTEAAVALDIGRDLGRALAIARTFEHEHHLVEELRQVADYKSRLVATVSHELRTPLTSIIGFLELLADQPELSARSHNAIEAIQRGSTRLARVVDELLVLHTAADGELEATEEVDLGPIVEEVADVHRGAALQRDITLTVTTPTAPAKVLGVAHELEHVVANLIGNAVKYTGDSGSVTVTLEQAAGQAVLTCTDTGIGIPVEEQARVFEEFFRSSDPDALGRTGSGLGLAIVRRVVDRHGGRVDLESELGRGSTFRVTLPTG